MGASDRDDQKGLRARAAERAAELKRRKAELQTHQPFDPGNVELAARRADEAHEWARKAKRAAADAFEAAAALHEKVARYTTWPSNISTVTQQNILTPPATIAKRHRKIAPAPCANVGKRNATRGTLRFRAPDHPGHPPRRSIRSLPAGEPHHGTHDRQQ